MTIMMSRVAVSLACLSVLAEGFSIAPRGRTVSTFLRSSPFQEPEDDPAVQWDLFKKHHAKGSWKGVWTTFDYIGDMVDETIASVNLDYDEAAEVVQQSHTIVVGAKQADCATCFDSFETKEFPVAQYRPEQMQKTRLGSIGMVNGPSLLRSGVMATELVLAYGDGRVRVVFQHAPVWEAGVEPGSGPPQGLKLFRAMISREALRDEPPTPATEAANPPTKGNPVFFRPVPPFDWHKEWSGTSWTWGPQTGNRGWMVDQMEEVDAWHGRPTGEGLNVWNLRLPGGILVQCPRIISGDQVELCRLAWLSDTESLLRMEVGVTALEPMYLEDDTMVGFHPPALGSLRCDLMKKVGELENAPSVLGEKDAIRPKLDRGSEDEDGESGLDAVRDALNKLM